MVFVSVFVVGALAFGDVAHARCVEEAGGDAGNRAKQARAIKFGTLTGCLAAGDDKDTFVLNVPKSPANTVVRLRTQALAGRKVCVAVRDASFGRVLSTCGEPRRPGSAWINVAGGTRIFLQPFRDGDVNRAHSIAYRLDITIAARIADRDEPNQGMAQAARLKSGRAHAAYIAAAVNQADPTDYYRIEAKAGQTIHVRVTDVPKRFFPVVRMFKPNKRILSPPLRGRGPGRPLVVSYRTGVSGTHYIALMHYGRMRTAYRQSKLPPRLVKPYRITVEVR